MGHLDAKICEECLLIFVTVAFVASALKLVIVNRSQYAAVLRPHRVFKIRHGVYFALLASISFALYFQIAHLHKSYFKNVTPLPTG